MRKIWFILLALWSGATLVAQDSIRLYVDTMQVEELVNASDDAFLLDIINRQAENLARIEDSIHQERLRLDTTTIIPLHLGYADSLRIAEQVRKQGGTTPLCMPQLYRPARPMHFAPLTYEARPDTAAPVMKPLEVRSPRQEARRYLTTHAAGLYTGTVEVGKFDGEYEIDDSKSIYELLIPEKSLVQDVEQDREDNLSKLRNQHNPWFKELALLLQFTQNYVSPNWFEGGNSSFAMYNSVKGVIKYDDKKRITWDNTLEWNAGFATTAGDTVHKINTSEDLFRIYSKLGVKTVRKLYGSFTMEFRSQVFPTYKGNSRELKTGFATPIRFNLGLGIDYKPINGLSVVFSPAAYKLVFAQDTVRASRQSYGIPDGQRLLSEFGSSVRVEWLWKPLRELQLETKFYMYTNYKMVELDMEVTADFIINRFLSTRLKLHPRYDSSLILDGDTRAKMQFKELLSIGFSHKFY